MSETKTIDYKRLKNNDFKDEKELRKYILENKEYFCEMILGIKYVRHIEEFTLKAVNSLYDKPLSIDLAFVDENEKVHFVELKNPKSIFSEMMRGIGQCLAYYYLARIHGYDLADVYMVTSTHCNMVPLIIRDNDLRIKYIYMSKDSFAKPNI